MAEISIDYTKIRNPELRKFIEEDFKDVLFSITTGHDHDGTNSKTVPIEGSIENNAVTEAKIAANAVTNSKIVDNGVTEGKIAANAVTTEKIKDANITTAKIHTDGLGTAAIADGAVTLAKMDAIARGSIIVGGASNAPTALNCKTDKQILIGDGTDLKSVAVSGDITITNAGAVAIGAKKVTTAMLADTASANAKKIADPGTGEAIPVTGSGHVPLAILDAAETNTLAVPTFEGQELTIYATSLAGTGTRTITVASAFDQSAHTTIAFNTAGDFVVLRGIKIGEAFAWRLVVNDGATLG